MSIRNITAVLATMAAVIAVAAPAAQASIRDELSASNKVERLAARYYPAYNVGANCDQETRTYFWCDVFGQSGDCYLSGHASVRFRYKRYSTEWWATIKTIQKTCI